MHHVLWSVLQDLWFFVCPVRSHTKLLLEADQSSNIHDVQSDSPALLSQTLGNNSPVGYKAWVVVPSAECLSRPVHAFDTVLGRVRYAQMVHAGSRHGTYVRIETTDFGGWVPASAITDNEQMIYPQFQSATVYGSSHKTTEKVRRLLADECLGGQLSLALQSVEYVLYRLKRLNRTIPWPSERPRLPGYWQSLLRGLGGVVMTIEPKTGSIMEAYSKPGEAFLAFVEEVHPDQTIKISAVGRTIEGEYSTAAITKDEWKEWRPVFISFQ